MSESHFIHSFHRVFSIIYNGSLCLLNSNNGDDIKLQATVTYTLEAANFRCKSLSCIARVHCDGTSL
jgi:hypothetical protein